MNGSPQTSTFYDDSSSEEFPSTIPSRETFPARTLILCFDGTGDQFDSDNSNIVDLVRMLRKDDHNRQMVYYQAGIGTYTSPNIATPLAASVSKILDEAIAWNFSAHVMEGYEFLMQNYRDGDRICLFGFSRGAYTARSLAGMIEKVGLLPACNHQQVPFAYKMYTREDTVGRRQSKMFKRTFSVEVQIQFIGVWDSVNSVGLIPRRLPYSKTNTIVKTFRHAISLDEHRAKFQVSVWNKKDEAKLGAEGQKPDVSQVANGESTSAKLKANRKSKKHKKKKSLKAMEKKHGLCSKNPTDVIEVWFSGCHCDVGGGSVKNGTPYSLARIPLRWMIRECFKTETGILFSSEALNRVGIDPETLLKDYQRPPPLPTVGKFIEEIPSKVDAKAARKEAKHEHRLGLFKTEEENELRDALSPIYDQLSLTWFWWFLELLPSKHHPHDEDETWVDWTNCNFGRGRHIPNHMKKQMKIHRSVRMRMDAQLSNREKYYPAAEFPWKNIPTSVEWVD
ncbi:hypothetical protein BDZ94DRAFT_1167539 [Collybia nuda]|uniref:T6SS Phospholipase effector Tle1-like catalytic domain-containing protein n=1 Tax=Collybia nuda TaxID=64659 RepID=A0A9P5Y592_9AGAR|nr:hypothetical protein BDZ94DRAFT_1167539 [Collybia nuda]